MPGLDFRNFRADGAGQADAFEEFAAQIFRRLDLAGLPAAFERYHGAGGDGGVEAIWRFATGPVTGLQAKFFLPVKSNHRAQLIESFDKALDNHPTLDRYIVALPFDPTPTIKERRGRGQQEVLDTWRAELVKRAAAKGRTVSVDWWLATELKDRLLSLPNADGRRLYWFGLGAVGKHAIQRRIDTARRIAGPRYSPVLKVGTPADNFIAAAGSVPRWFEGAIGLRRRVIEARSRITRSTASSDEIKAVESLDEVVELTRTWVRDLFDGPTRKRLAQLAAEGEGVAQRVSAAAEATFNAEHGAENDTPHFRQFQAEYNVCFPAGDLDRARDSVKLWTELSAFAASSEARVATGELALLFGPAGIGKTHAIIDACEQRLEEGLFSVPVLGEELHVSRDLWSFLADALDLPPTTARSQLVGAFAAAAERTGKPILLMFDAANETPSRERWRTWVQELVAETEGSSVRVLVSCRDVFAEETLGSGWDQLAAFKHPGFVGYEQAAAVAFAQHYNLAPPAEVIAQPEFANPLFLHLLCTATRAAGKSVIPAGAISLVQLVEMFLKSANDRAAADLDVDARFATPVTDGVRALAARMAEAGSTALPSAEAQTLLNSVHPTAGRTKSLLRALEVENLISIVPGERGYKVRFAFERLGDLLIADAFVRGLDVAGVTAAFGSGGALAHLVADEAAVARNAGLIQAFTIVVPESFGPELGQLVADPEAKARTAELALDVIAWRDPLKVVDPRNLVASFKTGHQMMSLFERVLAVATVPEHPIGADWLDETLIELPMVDRDALWSTALVRMWQGKGHAHRLIRLARDADLKLLEPKSARALGLTLCWFLACADRRVRDEATKGLVRLIMAAPMLGAQLVGSFANSDDDYILERVLTAAYGAGLRLRDPAYWPPLGAMIDDFIFGRLGGPPPNALIRDVSRLIVEKWREADPSHLIPARCAPPFTSPWPLRISSKNWEALREQYKNFPHNMFIEPNTASDFGRYVADGKVFGKFNLAAVGLTSEAATRWIFEETLRLGYPGKSKWGLSYDWALHNAEGSGRGKSPYAERLGKKYAWIQLARIAGILSDHAPPPTRRYWGPPPPLLPLQGPALRNLDPTVGVTPVLPVPTVDLGNFLIRQPTWSEALDEAAWVAAAAEHGFHPNIDGWSLLSLSFRDFERDEEYPVDWDEHHSTDVQVAAFAAKSSTLTKWSPDTSGSFPQEASAPEGVFMGELGFGFAEERLYSGDDKQKLLGLAVRPAFWRASSAFEKDFSGDDLVLLAPSEQLLGQVGAHWDGNRAWRDNGGNAVALHIVGKDLQGLVIRTEPLETALKQLGLALIWTMFASRNAKHRSDHRFHDQRRVFRRKRGKFVEIWSTTETSAEQEDEDSP